jgi:hypothetical protein
MSLASHYGFPEGFSPSDLRAHPTNKKYDQLDILENGVVVLTLDVDMSSCMGSGHEEALHHDAFRSAAKLAHDYHYRKVLEENKQLKAAAQTAA